MWIGFELASAECGTTHKVTFVDAELLFLGVKPATFIADFCVFHYLGAYFVEKLALDRRGVG
ncbi:hypothetical protein AB9K34_03115 [Sedimentitalea sp. XS_ASV28]